MNAHVSIYWQHILNTIKSWNSNNKHFILPSIQIQLIAEIILSAETPESGGFIDTME